MLGASFVGAFLYAFTTLLPVINPFSGAMFFVTLTGHLSDADRSYVAGRIALFSLIILMVCLFAVHIILGFFGISVGVLRCAGGIVLFAAGWNALNAPAQDGTSSPKMELPRSRLKAMAFYPFTLPLTTGPGDRVSRAVGAAGADALARIFAFILICLGVAVFWQGFTELWLNLGK